MVAEDVVVVVSEVVGIEESLAVVFMDTGLDSV